MSAIMTVAEVAEYFRHEAPESRAGAEFVRRLMAQGLPVLGGMRPARFLRHQVEAWAAERAAGVLQPDPPAAPKRRRASGAAAGQATIQERVRRMRGRGR